ncbi:MAG: YchJ family protein [Sulfuriferula sp.]
MSPLGATACPCGATFTLDSCCGRYLAGEAAPTAEALMRSRYTAFTLQDEAYLLSSWHISTRPASLDFLASPQPKWLGLKILAHHIQDENHATVEFVARSKLAGRAQRLHEVSRFVREDGRWYYLDGEAPPIPAQNR